MTPAEGTDSSFCSALSSLTSDWEGNESASMTYLSVEHLPDASQPVTTSSKSPESCDKSGSYQRSSHEFPLEGAIEKAWESNSETSAMKETASPSGSLY